MTNNLCEDIFNAWKASLTKKTKEHLYNNFFELFNEMNNAEISKDDVRPYIEKAKTVMAPSQSLVKSIYKSRPNVSSRSSLEDFSARWDELIDNKANEAFFDVFPLNIQKKEVPKKKSKYEGIDLHGMSEEEYEAQRAYADSFPHMKIDESIQTTPIDSEWMNQFMEYIERKKQSRGVS